LLLWTLWVIYRERRRVVRARLRGDTSVQPNVEALIEVLVSFRATALQLGGLLIKLGQFLSARADLLPEQALSILGSLQDEVPPAPYSHVAAVIEAELGRPVEQIFSELDQQTTAAASFGQVHKGVLLTTGQIVAVKVQRPGIDRLVRTDLSTMRFVIWVISRFVDTSDVIDLPGFYREVQRTTLEELDYVAEAANAQRFRELFQDRPGVSIPRVYEDYVSRRVLVLEWVDGIKINDYASLEAAGIDRLTVARQMVEAYLYQFFEAGFFHADPHPGNIFVLPPAGAPGVTRDTAAVLLPPVTAGTTAGPPDRHASSGDGTGPTVTFVDFGMVGTLAKSTKQAFRDLFLGFLAGSAHAMVDALQRLEFIGPGANVAALERGVALLLAQYRGISLGEARDLDYPKVVSEIEALFYGQPFRLPATFAFTGKAIGTVVGVATGLAPELNLIDVAVPYARRFLGLDAAGAGQTAQQLLSQVLAGSRSLLTLPAALERVVAKLETGQIEIALADTPGRRRGRSPATGRNSGAGGATAAAMVTASLAGGVVLFTQDLGAPGWFCLGLAGVIALAQTLRR